VPRTTLPSGYVRRLINGGLYFCSLARRGDSRPVRLYYALFRGPADVSAALRGATISSPIYWTGIALAFVAAFALGKYWARAAMSLSLGLALFVALGFVSMLVSAVRGPVTTAHATGVSAILASTVGNPIFYLVFIVCVLVGEGGQLRFGRVTDSNYTVWLTTRAQS